MKNNLIQANTATKGGGIFTQNTGHNVILLSNTITDNEAGYNPEPLDGMGGGGFYFTKESYVIMKDSIIYGNRAYIGDNNNGMYDSEGYIGVGEVGLDPSTLTIQYSNLDQDEVELEDVGCVIDDEGGGMINADPKFEVKTGGYDWETKFLDQILSPCIDTSNSTSPMIVGTTDRDGAQDAGILDMGFHYALWTVGPPPP